MNITTVIKSQYFAALTMLKEAISLCPLPLWDNPSSSNRFWHIVYHALFYTHFYLSPTEEDFVPWEFGRDEIVSLEDQPGEDTAVFSKETLLNYVDFCMERVDVQLDSLDLEAESGFSWLPFDKLELQIYSIRHLQQHTGELSERLGGAGKHQVSWVGMKME